MFAGVVLPSQLCDPCFGRWTACAFTLGGVHCKFEVELFAATVAVDLPIVDGQFAKDRSTCDRHPLSGWVDQMTDLIDGQSLIEIAASLERDDQDIAGTDVAAIAGNLITARGKRTAFGEGVSGIEQVVAEIVFGHDSRSIEMRRDLQWAVMLARHCCGGRGGDRFTLKGWTSASLLWIKA